MLLVKIISCWLLFAFTYEFLFSFFNSLKRFFSLLCVYASFLAVYNLNTFFKRAFSRRSFSEASHVQQGLSLLCPSKECDLDWAEDCKFEILSFGTVKTLTNSSSPQCCPCEAKAGEEPLRREGIHCQSASCFFLIFPFLCLATCQRLPEVLPSSAPQNQSLS